MIKELVFALLEIIGSSIVLSFGIAHLVIFMLKLR